MSAARCGGTCAPCAAPTPHCATLSGVTSCVACIADGECGAGKVCKAGACVDDGCPPPVASCTTGTESRDRCQNARTIGRKTAATSTGYQISTNTCSAYNRFDVCSWDAGADHAYRLYLRKGETTTIALSIGTGCVNSSWDATLHIFSNSGCGDVTCPTEEF